MDVQISDSTEINDALALARRCENAGDVDGHFEYLSQANRAFKERCGPADIEGIRKGFAIIKDVFTPDIPPFIVQNPKITPVFIVGMPRSGSTLVEQILDSHPMGHGGGEVSTLKDICGRALKSGGKITLRDVRQHYIDYLFSLGVQSSHITDKMTGNFMWIGFILICLPESKIIHVNRDPMAVCWSIFKNFFARQNPYTYDLRTIGQYYTIYQDMMTFWHQKYPGQIYDLSYEALTEDQEGQTRALLEYCGLPWDEACLRFYENDRPVKTASAEQVRRPMYQGSSDDWKRYEKHLGPLKEVLGC